VVEEDADLNGAPIVHELKHGARLVWDTLHGVPNLPRDSRLGKRDSHRPRGVGECIEPAASLCDDGVAATLACAGIREVGNVDRCDEGCWLGQPQPVT
jgi:hypothetical protein